MEQRVYEYLRRAGDYVSGKVLGKELGLTRGAVWKTIRDLRKAGHEILAAPRRGYCLASALGALSPVEMEKWAEGASWEGELYVLDTIDSTNSYAKELAARGVPHGTVVVANAQTGGRGRMGRSFLSPGGMGVYLSMILRPRQSPEELMHLTCCTAVAMADAVEEATGLRPGIKWTNDLVAGARKLGGILTELAVEAESGRVQYAIVGVGINCGQKPADFDPSIRDMAGSLEMTTGKPIDRNRLIGTMIRKLVEMSRTMEDDRLVWMKRYRQDCITLGRAVSIRREGEDQWGQALDVDDWGALLVDFGQGPETIQAGEVSVRGVYGYV